MIFILGTTEMALLIWRSTHVLIAMDLAADHGLKSVLQRVKLKCWHLEMQTILP